MLTPVCSIAALSHGETALVKVAGRDVLLSQIDGQYYAVAGHCSHAAQSLAHGKLRDYEIACSLHGARFDVRSGLCTRGPADSPIQRFPVVIEGGKVCVEV